MANSHAGAAFAAVTGLGVLLGGAGGADAALVQSFHLDENGSPTSLAQSFDQGNSGVLSLVEVDITLSAISVGGGAQVSITGAEGGSNASRSFTASLQIIGPGGLLEQASTGATDSCTVSVPFPSIGNCGVGGSPVPPTAPVFSTNPIVLTGAAVTPFAGTGTVDLTAAISAYTPDSTCTLTGSPPFGSCGGSDNLTWDVTATISYLFEPAITAAPEPASLGIFGLGIVTTLLARRRRGVDASDPRASAGA